MTTLLSSTTRCEPRWETPRSNRRSFGPQIAVMAERLGQPLMPWQRLVADIGGEIDPDTGFPAYREVIVTVPRQSGKTTLILGWECQRCTGFAHLGAQRVVYSAQTGNDARKKLIEDQVPILEPRKAKLGIRRILRGMGNEAVEFKNGSRVVLLASSEDSGHGKTVDLAVKDELFADFDDRRDQALIPAMATKAAAQILTASTMGTEASVPWNRAVERGRRAVEKGERSGIAYFEWSAPADADPDDPAVWWSCMPALGFTINEPVVRHARETLKDGEFRRAFLNQQTKAEDRVIPSTSWAAVCDRDARPGDRLVFALDANPERSSGSIASASGGSVPTAELVAWAEGVGWMVSRAAELSKKWGDSLFVVSQTGPAASLIPDLQKAGVKVHTAGPRDEVQACGRFFDAVMEGKVVLRTHARLDSAAAGAAKRASGDAWAWARRSPSVDVSPLVAVTLAVWGASTLTKKSARFVSFA
jgi:hypothetical protein